jgi:hypothetical protein
MSAYVPRARKERLVTRELPGELLVYDLERHKASCLNRMAMATWRRCDGRASVPELAAELSGELGVPVDERAVWLALERLSQAHLLEEPVVLPPWAEGYARREWVASVAKASALLVPAVVSILSPTAAAAASAITTAVCAGRTTAACGGQACVTGGMMMSGAGVCQAKKGKCACA